MKPSPEKSRDAGRARLAIVAAAPLAVLAFAVYAFSGAPMKADVAAAPVAAAVAPAPVPAATPAASSRGPEESPVMSQHDAELFAYRPHGG